MVAVSYAGWRCAYPAYKTNLFLHPVGRVRRSRHPAFFLIPHTHRLGFTPAVQPVGAEIIARADAALYRAKEAGRDRWSL
ncbi:hypothetical protein FYA22_10430 [Enterobacter hormaechei]|nr:hypothetical protein FYA23_10430 [Enterobacter hormaechei]QEI71555.1 hypothetical protein FYA22_10430 [Enterobacter hormaechei]